MSESLIEPVQLIEKTRSQRMFTLRTLFVTDLKDGRVCTILVHFGTRVFSQLHKT